MPAPANVKAEKLAILYTTAHNKSRLVRRKTVATPLKERVQILLALKDNEFDYQKTAAEYNISKRSLIRWKCEMGDNVYKHDDDAIQLNLDGIDQEVASTRKELIVTNNQILTEAVSAEFEIIKRIRVVAQNTGNLFALANSLKILHEITTHKLAGEDDGKSPTLNQSNTFTQFIEKQVIQLEEDIKWRDNKLGQNTQP